MIIESILLYYTFVKVGVEIIKGKRQITIDTALRLSKYFGNSVEFWVGIQADYEIRKAKKVLEKQLAQINQREVVVA